MCDYIFREEEAADYPLEGTPEELIEMINVRMNTIKECMQDKNINRRRFDSYSYMLWAIEFFMDNLYDSYAHMDIPTIRELISIHIDQYRHWIATSRGNHDRWDAALDAMLSLKMLSDWFV